jgi:hypothetical protein
MGPNNHGAISHRMIEAVKEGSFLIAVFHGLPKKGFGKIKYRLVMA